MATVLDLPPIFLLPTHLDPDRLHDLEKRIPSLTYDIHEAEIILGNISKKERALFELRHRKLQTDPVEAVDVAESHSKTRKRKWDATLSDSDSTTYTEDDDTTKAGHSRRPRTTPKKSHDTGIVRVVKLTWLTKSLEEGQVLPVHEYLIYQGRKKYATESTSTTKGSDILPRATVDAISQNHPNSFAKPGISAAHSANQRPVPSLIRQTTSEHDSALKLPAIPSFLRTTYACERATPADPPNIAFIEELKKIRTARKLMGDQVGVRAYSTSIATISAYPYSLSSPQEVARLPGCGTKIAELWHEWKDAGRLREADETQADPKLSVIQMFYEIWGVGDTTARDFYRRGWRDLDDVVEYGWDSLSRVQQIGVKFYDEFKLKIPRTEVESIADTILKHARKFSRHYQMVIVGGFRRGKQGSGDVDVIISHPDASATLHFIEKLVVSLEKSGHVTHTLTLSNHNSERGQQPLSWKGNEARGTGFDTLDKALVVWQEPSERDVGKSSAETSGRPHRRVDIILSPWKTAGCAVLGWSGDTTFQRDLRRYCKKQKNLKFDSSGIRSRMDGSWVDLEGDGKMPDMLTAEKRVFEGLGLAWVSPEDRCTG